MAILKKKILLHEPIYFFSQPRISNRYGKEELLILIFQIHQTYKKMCSYISQR